jgi:hypothetical protein
VADIDKVIPDISGLIKTILKCVKGSCSVWEIVGAISTSIPHISVTYTDCSQLYDAVMKINVTNPSFQGCVNDTLTALGTAGKALADIYLEEGDYVGNIIRTAESGVYALKSCQGQNKYAVLATVYFHLSLNEQACLANWASLGGSAYQLFQDIEKGKPLVNKLEALQEITTYLMFIYDNCTKLLPSEIKEAIPMEEAVNGAFFEETGERMLVETCTLKRVAANIWRLFEIVMSDEPIWLLVYNAKLLYELLEFCASGV